MQRRIQRLGIRGFSEEVRKISISQLLALVAMAIDNDVSTDCRRLTNSNHFNKHVNMFL